MPWMGQVILAGGRTEILFLSAMSGGRVLRGRAEPPETWWQRRQMAAHGPAGG